MNSFLDFFLGSLNDNFLKEYHLKINDFSKNDISLRLSCDNSKFKLIRFCNDLNKKDRCTCKLFKSSFKKNLYFNFVENYSLIDSIEYDFNVDLKDFIVSLFN